MEYLIKLGLSEDDIKTISANVSDDIYSDMTFLANVVIANVQYMRDFGIANYGQVLVKYPEIFIRDEDSFRNVFSKFDAEDLKQKVAKNVAVFKKMVDYVDNN